MKGSIVQEEITILNVHDFNKTASKYMSVKFKGEIDKCSIIIGDFNTLLKK